MELQQLAVLTPPARGKGCVNRFVETVDLGEGLGQVQLIVSGCQMPRFVAGIDAKLAEVRGSGLERDAMREELQSWIDGGSPCDMPYADPEDRLSDEEAMAAEMAFFASRMGVNIPPGTDLPPIVVFTMLASTPGMFESPYPRRRRGIPWWLLVYFLVALTYLVLQVIRLIW